ncbi:hypothetical protein [Amycolatopsis sp. NPDC006125]|uniref:hypothetical protein n=1 Tax=Amycolatopsis sp. NPDC006125 TaxID=3156730 RepID=UPI0033A05C81
MARMIERIHTGMAPFVRFPDGTEPPLSQAMRAGDLVFTSGQGPLDPATHEIRPTSTPRCEIDGVAEIV